MSEETGLREELDRLARENADLRRMLKRFGDLASSKGKAVGLTGMAPGDGKPYVVVTFDAVADARGFQRDLREIPSEADMARFLDDGKAPDEPGEDVGYRHALGI